MEVVDRGCSFFLVISYCFNSCRLRFELASEGLLAILHSYGVTAFGVGRDVDVEAYDIASVDGFLVDEPARFVSDAYLIGIVERIEIDA